jgi:hypothetical protein
LGNVGFPFALRKSWTKAMMVTGLVNPVGLSKTGMVTIESLTVTSALSFDSWIALRRRSGIARNSNLPSNILSANLT